MDRAGARETRGRPLLADRDGLADPVVGSRRGKDAHQARQPEFSRLRLRPEAAARAGRRGSRLGRESRGGDRAAAAAGMHDDGVGDAEGREALEREVMETVDKQLGAIGRPKAIHFVSLLPKTRSGKTLRRTIQALAEGRDPGDLTTIEDPAALEQIRNALNNRPEPAK